MNTHHLKVLVVAILVLFSSNILAGSLWCTGVPTKVRIWAQADNWVSVGIDTAANDTWLICKYDETIGAISPERCRAMYSTLLSALMSGKKVQLGFYDTNYTDCNAIPSWDGNVPANFWNLTILAN